MTRPSQFDRRKLVDALGLGPLWVRRTRAAFVEAIALEDDETALDWEALQRMVASGRASGLRTGELPASRKMRIEWLVIVGRSVDRDGDVNGDAVAGPAGRLLDAMLAAIGLGRDRTVFVAGLDTQVPSDIAVATGPSCLEHQIALLAPQMILAVGEGAVAAMFPDAADFDDFRGRPHVLSIAGRDIPVVATFHPAQLLDDGSAKARAWVDLCLARTIHEQRSAAVFA